MEGDFTARLEWVRDNQVIQYVDGVGEDSLLIRISVVGLVHEGEYFCRMTLSPSVRGQIGLVSAGNLTVLGTIQACCQFLS